MIKKISHKIKFLIPFIVLIALIVPTITVYAAAIDAGPGATDRASTWPVNYTAISLTNPADGDGTLTSFEIWANTNLSGCRVGTFYLVSGTTYKCRDNVTIGNVTSGSKQTFDLSGTPLNVITGDFIGIYFTGGTVERSSTGHMVYYSGEAIDDDDQVLYQDYNNNDISIYATGATSATTQPTVTSSAASSISYTTATLNGEITDFGTATNATVTFEYGETIVYGSTATADESPVSGTGTVHADLTGLNDGTLYHFRVKVDADDTDPVYGSDLTFTTLTQTPTVITESAISIAMDLNGVTSGNFSGDITSLGDDTGAEGSFQYGMSTSYELGETGAVAYNSTGVFGDAIPSDLLPGNTYYYRAKAVNVHGTSYGSAGNFTLTMPTFTTDNAIYTSPGTASATLAGNVTNMGVASNATVYFQWGTNTTYGTDTADQIVSVISDITQAISGFLRNVTIHFRTATEVGSNTTYGVDETFLIATPALAEQLWYQPIDVITQSGTDWIVPDRDGTEDGVITWGTNPTGVTAEQGPFGGGVGGGTEAKAPPYAIGDPGDFIETDPPISGNFTTDITPDFPGSDILDDLADASSTPVQLIWMLITGFIILVISLTSSWMMKRFGNASHFIKGAIIFGLMGICIGLDLYDWWMIMIFAVIALALSWMSQQRGATN